jgi:hypothetical protein
MSSPSCHNRTVRTSKVSMRKKVFFVLAVCSAFSVSARPLRVDSFESEKLHLIGSYCQFGGQRDTRLVSDWDKKFWMKIDGRMVVFESDKSDAESEKQLRNKRWQEALKADDIIMQIDLVEIARGDDSAAYRGHIDVQRGATKKRLLIAGGCGA